MAVRRFGRSLTAVFTVVVVGFLVVQVVALDHEVQSEIFVGEMQPRVLATAKILRDRRTHRQHEHLRHPVRHRTVDVDHRPTRPPRRAPRPRRDPCRRPDRSRVRGGGDRLRAAVSRRGSRPSWTSPARPVANTAARMRRRGRRRRRTGVGHAAAAGGRPPFSITTRRPAGRLHALRGGRRDRATAALRRRTGGRRAVSVSRAGPTSALTFTAARPRCAGSRPDARP